MRRSRLFAVALAVIVVVEVVVGAYLTHGLRQSLEIGEREDLTRHAKSAGALLEGLDAAASIEAIDRIADRAGDATSTAITIVDVDGRVVGDSAVAVAELEQLVATTHAPECLAAQRDGVGFAIRPEGDSGRMFVAVKIAGPEHVLVARASRSLRRIDAMTAQLSWALFYAGLIAVAVVLLALMVLPRYLLGALHSDNPQPEHAPATSERSVAEDLQQMMAELAAERNLFEAVLQAMQQAVVALGPDQRVTTVNEAARRLLSLDQEVVGRSLVEAIRSPRLVRVALSAQVGQASSEEFDIAGGRRVEAQATRQTDGAVVLVVLDVTEIRRLERVRRDFVANVSHELRTPISVIKANSETLLDGALEDKVRGRQFAEAVLRHADRLGRLVSDLLDISRIEAGRYHLEITDHVIDKVVDHVLDLVEDDAATKDIELAVTIEPDLLVTADRKALEQILVNLVSNAVKYTATGGHVEVTAHCVQDKVRVEIIDNGPGIDPAHRGRIFERFYRADPGRSREMGGTGLGLSIVKHLVEAMDGEAGVDPRSPQGSVFWFVLAGRRNTSGPRGIP